MRTKLGRRPLDAGGVQRALSWAAAAREQGEEMDTAEPSSQGQASLGAKSSSEVTIEPPRQPGPARWHRDRRAPVKNLVDALEQPFLVLDEQLRVRAASGGFCEKLQVSRADGEGCHLSEVGDGSWNVAGLRQKLLEV